MTTTQLPPSFPPVAKPRRTATPSAPAPSGTYNPKGGAPSGNRPNQPKPSHGAGRALLALVGLVGLLGGLGLLGGKWLASLGGATVDRLSPAVTGTQALATSTTGQDETAGQVQTVDPDAIPTLDAVLMERYATAAKAAAAEGLELSITSGARSVSQQQAEFEAAVAEYGSAEEAAKWVAAPDVSAHVKGKALDIGPQAGWEWLGRHQSEYGLCQVYANEPWHFEATIEVGGTCPDMLADATGER